MRHQSEQVTAADRTMLHVHRWTGPAPAVRRMLIVHGAGEHGARYEHFAACAVERGWEVLAADSRGHGRSGGVPTHVARFEQYLTDLELLWRRAAEQPLATGVYSHSLGALTVIRALQLQRDFHPAAVVVSSPLLALKVRVPRITRALGAVLAWTAPRTRFRTAIRSEDLTRSDWGRRRRDEDPLGHKSVTARWFQQTQRAAAAARRAPHRVHVPVLLQQGDADPVVDPERAVRWWLDLGARDRTLRLAPGGMHELITEPDWESTAAFVLEWLEARVPANPAGGARVSPAG